MVEPEVRAELRLAVHRLRRATRARLFPPLLQVGDLFGESVEWPLEDAGDHPATDLGLRGEIAAALLSRALLHGRRPGAWLTRVGHPDPHDLDLAWMPVVDRVFAEAGVVPRFLVVLTKGGWYEPTGDDRATWTRLRVLVPA